jgi:hypothetical protein
MSTKEEILEYIKTLAEHKIISREELNSAYNSGLGAKEATTTTKRIGIAEILYYIGGGVVFLGISILIYQNWSTLGLVTKILATLGFGIVAYFVGLLFSRDKRTENVSSAFYFISALLSPLGLWIMLDNAGLDANSSGYQSIVSGILLLTYLLSYIVFRKNIFLLFTILFSTWLFFSLTNFIIGPNPYFGDWKFFEYRILVTGISYILLGYSFSKNEHLPLTGFLYGFGVLGFLGGAMALGGWKPKQNIFWEIIYPVLVFGVLFFSVHIKSKAFLTWGTIFLMAYILKITSEYFSTGLGWPLALVIAGLAMIGTAFIPIYLKKRYIQS